MAATLTDAGELTYLSFGIDKIESTPDGDLMVYGMASDGSVDADQQVVSPAWMAKAVQEWLATGPNLRVQHNPQRDPAGIGLTASTDGKGATWVKALVVEPVAKKLVSTGALRAYSVGIARPVIERDITGKARGGIITDGSLVEVSLVDRPANARCAFQLVKNTDDGHAEYVGKIFGDEQMIARFAGTDLIKGSDGAEAASAEPAGMSINFTPDDLMKIMQSKIVDRHYDELATKALRAEEAEILGKDHREFSEEERRHQASESNALPDGSYPIPDADALRRAAILARSKHGNWQAASRLIARRAKELGVPNPMSESSESKGESVTDAPVTTDTVVKADDQAAKEAEPVITKDPADGDGPGPKSKKKPKGKKLPPWLNQDKADTPPAKADGDADEDESPAACKLDHAHTAKCSPSGTPKSASGAADAADMQEIPSTSPPPESPMPAGRRTPDTKGAGMSPESAAMLRFKSIGVDTDLGRLHDLTCPAYDPENVVKYHPFADFSTVIDSDVWMRKAVDAACGPMDRAIEMTKVWEAAQALKDADAGDLNDYRLEMHKAFRDANPGPSSYPSPGSMSPGRFNRPCITQGHAAESPGHDSPDTSLSVADSAPSAGHFDRPPLGSGHQSPSPSFMKADFPYPAEQGVPTRITYAQVEKEKARQALSLMHDHVSRMFPPLCPMTQGAQQPESRPVPAPAGKSGDAPEVREVATATKAVLDEKYLASLKKGMKKKLGKRVLAGKMTVDEARAKLGRKVTQKAQLELAELVEKGVLTADEARAKLGLGPWQPDVPALRKSLEKIAAGSAGVTVLPPGSKTESEVTKGIDPDIIKNAVAEAIAPLVATVESQQKVISEQEARWEATANLADPKTASFSGLALNPVQKSARPVAAQAEIAERTQQMIRRQLHHTWRTSENPAEREAAYAELSKYGITE